MEIERCCGVLKSIVEVRSGKVIQSKQTDLYFHNEVLKFHPSEIVRSKTPQYLEVIAIVDDRHFAISGPRSFVSDPSRHDPLIGDCGDYILEVVVSASNTSSISLKLLFEWRGRDGESSLKLLNGDKI